MAAQLALANVDFNTIAYRLTKLIYVGNRSHIYRATLGNDAQTVVIVKKIPLEHNDVEASDRLVQKMRKFIAKVSPLDHVNVVKMYGFQIVEPKTPTETRSIAVFMEDFPDSLARVINKRPEQMTLANIQKWTKDILLGLDYIHKHDIVHRNLKAKVIFLDANNVVKIGGLTVGRELSGNKTRVGEVSQNRGAGWDTHMSPEWMLAGMNNDERTNIGRRTDIWSLGCVVLEMLTHRGPRFVKDGVEVTGQAALTFVTNEGGRPEYPENCDHRVREFLDKCFVHEQINRASATDLLQSDFITTNVV